MKKIKRTMISLALSCSLFFANTLPVKAEDVVQVSNTAPFVRWHQSAFGAAWYQWDETFDVKEAKDGGFITSGRVFPWENHAYGQHASIIKYNKNGSLSWNKSFGGGAINGNGSNACFNKVIQLANGDFLAVGSTDDDTGISVKDYLNMFVVRLDNTGNIKWQKVFGAQGRETSMWATGAQENPDKTLTILGNYQNKYNNTDRGYPICMDITLSETGNLLSSALISDDQSNSAIDSLNVLILRTSDGGYLIKSESGIPNIPWTTIITKLDATGKILWGNYVIPKDSEGNFVKISGTKMQETSDGYIFVSTAYTDKVNNKNNLFVYKEDFQGNLIWKKLISKVNLADDISMYDLNVYPNHGNILITTTNGYSTIDFTVLQMSSSTGSVNWVKSYGTQTGFDRNYGGNAAFSIVTTSSNMLFGSGNNFVTKIAADGSIAFKSEDFTVQARSGYQCVDAVTSKDDAGYWARFIPTEITIGEKSVSYSITGNAADTKVVTVETVPPKPAQVVGNNLSLTWDPVNGATGYNIYRSETAGSFDNTTRTDFPLTTTTFVDDQVDKDIPYYYQIRPIMSNGTEGEPIAEFSGTVSSKPANKIILQLNNAYMEVNGVNKEVDPGRGTTPVIISGRTVLPIRALVEAIGGSISWDAATQKISLTAKGITVDMWIGKKDITVNGTTKKIDVAPVILNGRTMVPLRFAAENLNCTVNWDATTQKVEILY